MFQIVTEIDKNDKICIAQQSKDLIKLEMTEDWDKITGQVVEQPSPKDNGNFLCGFVIEIKD